MSDIGMMKRIILLLIIFASCDQRQQPRRDDLGDWRVDGGIALGCIKWGNEDEIKNAIDCFIVQNNLTDTQVLMKSEHDESWQFII